MTALLERKPDALDLAEILELAGRDLIRCAEGTLTEALVNARSAAQRVLAALDAYEARS